MTNLQSALQVLREAGVEFVVIGAVAAAARGSSYSTQDLDLCYERSPKNLARLAAALQPHHPRLRDVPGDSPFVLDAASLAAGVNFTLATDLGDLDLMGEVAGVGQYPQVSAGASILDLFGQKCAVASLDVLIQSKRAAGRPKDLLVLPELEALRDLERARRDKK